MNYRIPVFAFLSFIYLTSCNSDDVELIAADVKDDLQTYVERFEKEAAVRSILIDVGGLGVHLSFVDIPEDNVLGVCFYHSNALGRIEIDQPTWSRLSDLGKEYVVFHELGHCVLARGHSEQQYTNGSCKSIMASGTGNCHENYSASTRTRYLNELFSSFD